MSKRYEVIGRPLSPWYPILDGAKPGDVIVAEPDDVADLVGHALRPLTEPKPKAVKTEPTPEPTPEPKTEPKADVPKAKPGRTTTHAAAQKTS